MENEKLDELVRSPHWRWMPGMRATDGGRLLTALPDGTPATWHIAHDDGLDGLAYGDDGDRGSALGPALVHEYEQALARGDHAAARAMPFVQPSVAAPPKAGEP